MSKKVNPRRRPASMADVNKAKAEASQKALQEAIGVVFLALLDRGVIRPEQKAEAWAAVIYMSDSLERGYIKRSDLLVTLREEYGMNIF